MARYPSPRNGQQGGQTRIWIYVTSSLFLVAILYCGYHILGRRSQPNRRPNPRPLIDANVEQKLPLPAPKSQARPEPDLSQVAPKPTAESNPQVAKVIDEALALIKAEPSRVVDARDRLNELLPLPMSAQQLAFVKTQLSQLSARWLFGPLVLPNDKLCDIYKVKPGDQLRLIGRQCKVPHEILMEINNIKSPEALQAGRTMKVINGPFHARVYRSTFTLDLFLRNTYVRSFFVGLGKPGRETPTGLWIVKDKLISPTWTDPDTFKTYKAGDPDYPLGSRWISLKGIEGQAKDRTGFAIHGTKDPQQIGTPESRGCIRMHNGDAILIYNLLVPHLSKVEVVD